MTRVVRARREFVHQQPAVAREKKFDAHDADHVERFQDRARNPDGLARGLFGDARGRDRQVEYVSAVRVLDDAVVSELATHGARSDDRNLTLEIDESLDDSLLTFERFDRALRVFVG